MVLCGTKNVFLYGIALRTFWSNFIFKSLEGQFLVPHSVRGSLKNHLLLTFFIIWRTFFRHEKPFVKQKGSSDVKSYLWNHLDKKGSSMALLFLRV